MTTLPPTCHSQAWALIRRNGDTPGKRVSTRMACLVGTIAPNDTAVALTGYIMRNDMTGWTNHPRRIEWADIVRQWSRQPSVAEVRKSKRGCPWRTRELTHADDGATPARQASLKLRRMKVTKQTDERDLEKLLDEVEALCGVYVGKKAESEEWGETCRRLERLDKLVKKLRGSQAGR